MRDAKECQANGKTRAQPNNRIKLQRRMAGVKRQASKPGLWWERVRGIGEHREREQKDEIGVGARAKRRRLSQLSVLCCFQLQGYYIYDIYTFERYFVSQEVVDYVTSYLPLRSGREWGGGNGWMESTKVKHLCIFYFIISYGLNWKRESRGDKFQFIPLPR